LPPIKYLKRTIQRKRTNKEAFPRLPTSLNDLVIPEHTTLLENGENFLMKDTGVAAGANRILIFSTHQNLEFLARSEMVFSDGTFDHTPPPFYQMYTFHGIVYGKSIPLVYMLLPKKDIPTYRSAFQELKLLQVRIFSHERRSTGSNAMIALLFLLALFIL
jgi:hypothetical protein